MRRLTVPAIAPTVTVTVASRLEGMLRGDVRPVYDPKLQPLDGVWWPRPVRRVAAPTPGDVAMFDVTDPGELQDWEPRGIDHG